MGDSDSEDSDGEGGLGNVSRVIIRPPGQSGKAKRGHLCFDAAFETGNLGKAELIGEFEYDLFLRPDTCNPRYRFWFNFTVENVRQDQRVLFHIVNFSKPRNLFNADLTPLVKSSSRPKWQRMPKRNVFYYRSALHQNHYVLSFAFIFDKEDDVYQFALSPPYSYSRLQSYLNMIDSRQTDKRFTKSVLAKTLQNRNLDLLTVDLVSDTLKCDRLQHKCMRVIIILCRSHSGEAPASFVCQGFIEFLISNHPIAVILRENFIFKIIPMVNPDGVFLGNNRCNLIGQDLNRTWQATTEFSQPTLHAIKNLLKELDNSDIYQIDFVIDLHAHSSLQGCFIYGNTYDDVYRYERHLVFPRLFASNTADYMAEGTMYNADDRKSGCARRYCCERLSDTVNSYTLEVSMGGYCLKDSKTFTIYNEDGYYRCGRNLARTFLHYYRFINVLPTPLISDIHLKRRSRPRSHFPRSPSASRCQVKARPKTTRSYAPISYTNISICYDSAGSSDGEFSPIRPSTTACFSQFDVYKRFHHRAIASCAVHSSDHVACNTCKPKTSQNSNILHGKSKSSNTAGSQVPRISKVPDLQLNVPPKPYLSIIDLNKLTRGCLDPKL